MRLDRVLSGMIAHSEKILDYTRDLDKDAFQNHDMIVEACVFNLSQIGELAGRIDEETRLQHPEIAWNRIRGLRNRLVHDYEGVNRQLIWEIISEDLPALIDALKKLAQTEEYT